MSRDKPNGVAGNAASRLLPVAMSAHIDLQDQVPRKLTYLREHPDTDIIAPCRHEPMWEATLDDGNVVIQALQLSLLLDQLEKLC